MNNNFASIQQKNRRIDELDFFKSIFILLMITFHLAYFGDGHPYLKKFVYTFHMPGFLIISGYLMNINKTIRNYGKNILWIAVPYIVMETGYVLMASVLPIRDRIDGLSVGILINKLTVNPLGPYWYLHTLILCGILYFAVFRLMKAPVISRLIVLGLSFYGCARLGLVSFACSMYFLAGVLIRQSGCGLLQIVRKSWWSVAALTILFLNPSAFDKATFGGILIVYFVFSLSFSIYDYIPMKVQKGLLFLGRNSLVLYIFSPIFTICCKIFVPYLAFDSTRLLFLCLSLPICIAGSLALCKLLDLLRISPFMFGRRTIIK
jgi:fucose 4-O-acetylase-like acetyltransferase